MPVKESTNEQMITKTDTLVINETLDISNYHPSYHRKNDLLHTQLDVRFNWEKEYLFGNATLKLKPYYYPTSKLTLDAKGFDIHEVSMIKNNDHVNLNFTYDSLQLHIELDTIYTSKEQYVIYIDYTAKPAELTEGGSDAITSDRGLYFVNPDGKELKKPMQIWTQGETEASSCWFPTIDKPNERTTQELNITIDTNFVTLSNGDLIYSTDNNDGTRTDHWKMDKPHAPYLFMMAIGEYAVITDMWRDSIEVSYYVEPEYAPYARDIFANTLEMLEYYSTAFGVDYPWSKFSQVIVRDYVSGAMENTTAVVFNERVQRTRKELIDGGNDGIVSHELTHQWFGDLVTCESWSNTALNESLATYGQYLWNKYKYGREEADYNFHMKLKEYIWHSKQKKDPIIRYYYEDKEDMFDILSYNKGGLVLKMLHNYVGDEAFFQSLNLYLTDRQYNSAELDHLRLAFEEVTGEDLNWFFKPWFIHSGHPKLNIDYEIFYHPDSGCRVAVSVIQDISDPNTSIFRLPTTIDIYSKNKVERHEVIIDERFEIFTFEMDSIPLLINFDGEKSILCEKEDNKTTAQFAYQYYHGPLFLDRYEAIKHCIPILKTHDLAREIVVAALKDKYWGIRKFALNNIDSATASANKLTVVNMALQDEKSNVRSAAIKVLSKLKGGDLLGNVYKRAIYDSSNLVASRSLKALHKHNHIDGMEMAKTLETSKSRDILYAIAGIYADTGSSESYSFLEKMIEKESGTNKYVFVSYYLKFLGRMDNETVINGLNTINLLEFTGLPKWYIGRLERKFKRVKEKYIAKKLIIEKESISAGESDPKENEALKKTKTILDLLESILEKLT